MSISVPSSTKAALIANVNGSYHILASHYRRTEGNPILAVQHTMKEILKEIEEKNYDIKKIVAATTGSGRYLTAYFIGAELIKDEITAQASGTATYLDDENITIIEIGGQDSKFIQLHNSNIADFEMNWACAAGTGALIEKHAKNLDLDIKDFGSVALLGDKRSDNQFHMRRFFRIGADTLSTEQCKRGKSLRRRMSCLWQRTIS